MQDSLVEWVAYLNNHMPVETVGYEHNTVDPTSLLTTAAAHNNLGYAKQSLSSATDDYLLCRS